MFLSQYRQYFHATTFKQVLWLAFPIIVGQLGTVLMGVADTIMVGQWSAVSLAACGFSNAIYFLVSIIPVGFFLVLAPQVSAAQSSNDPVLATKLYRAVFWCSLWLSLACLVVLSVLYFCLSYFGQEVRVIEESKSYYILLCTSTFPLVLFVGLKQITDGLSKPQISMYVTVAGLLLNIILNALFIYGAGPVPAMGLLGAGIATSISRWMMALTLWLTIYIQRYTLELYHSIDSCKQEIVLMMKIGIPSGFAFFYEVAAFNGAAIMIGWIGSYSLAAHNIALNIASVSYMVSTGFAAATSILLGQGLGEGNTLLMKRSIWAGYVSTACFMMSICLLLCLFPSFWIRLYTFENDVVEIALPLLSIAALFQLFDGTQSVSLACLRAMSDVKIPSMITLGAYWVVALPLGYLLAFYGYMGALGIWMGLLLGLVISSSTLTFRLYKILKISFAT